MGLSWPRWRIMLGDGVQNCSQWPKMTRKRPPRWPKKPPGWPQTPPRRPRTGPRRQKIIEQNNVFSMIFSSSAFRCRGSFRRPLRSPTGTPRLPKMALRRPRMAPRRPKMPPRRAKTTQDASKTLQDGPRRPPEAKNDPKCLEKGSSKTKNTSKDGHQNVPRHLKLRLEGRGGAPRSAGSIRIC